MASFTNSPVSSAERQNIIMKIKPIIRLLGVGALLVISGVSVIGNFWGHKVYLEEKKQKEKNIYLKQLFVRWLYNSQNGIKISDYLEELNIKTIAIYGMSDAGCKLYEELKNSNIVVKYVIDKRMIETDIEVVTIDDDFKEVDIIIVTAIYEYNEIVKELKKKTKSPVISLEQVVYEAESCRI